MDGPNDELGRLCVTFDRSPGRLEAAFESERGASSPTRRTNCALLLLLACAEVELALMHERTPDAYRAAPERLQRETQRLEALHPHHARR